MYDPQVGRWLSEDPIGFAGGDANLNRYVENSPTTLSDPEGLEPNWHHFLPIQFEEWFNLAGITNIHSAEYGWVIDSEYHLTEGVGNKLHTGEKSLRNWNTCWANFKDKNPGAKAPEILEQLERMKLEFSHILRNGAQATMSHSEWTSYLRKLRQAAAEAKAVQGIRAVSITRKIGTVVKVIGVITFAYTASTAGVSVAFEGCTEDALFPYLDLARSVANPAADYYQAQVKGGILNQRRNQIQIDKLLNDPVHADLPTNAGGYRVKPRH